MGRAPGRELPRRKVSERVEDDRVTMLIGRSTEVLEDDDTRGTVALAVLNDSVSSSRLTLARRSLTGGTGVPTGSLVVIKDIAPGTTVELTFVIACTSPTAGPAPHLA